MSGSGQSGLSAAGRGSKALQRRLADEVASQREALLQACWAHGMWNRPDLATADGERLGVLSPGWLNRGAGPDFTEARLLIGGREHWGDVEIHILEKDWWEHGHDGDPKYERVILHLVLRRGERSALRPVSGEPIPVFDAAPFLAPQILASMHDPEELLRSYENIPGRCGLRAVLADPRAVGKVVAHAAERRARDKAEQIAPSLKEVGEEQALFLTLFRYLGYRPYGEYFERLAARYPLAVLQPLLALDCETARAEVLARWFGALGLLEGDPPPGEDSGAGKPGSDGKPGSTGNPDNAEEFRRLQAIWRSLDHPPLVEGVSRAGSRPWNSPERRMVGFFHHLYAMGAQGWLKGWLAFLRSLDRLRDRPEFRKEALHSLEEAFATPDWEPWRTGVSFHHWALQRPARLIGRERIVMLMANAVLPFFLAMARQRKDAELEKVLYRLYIVLPPEGANRRTRFMEKRLAGVAGYRKTLRTQQGLLQIHQDFCTSFHEGCDRCGFPDLIAPQTGTGA